MGEGTKSPENSVERWFAVTANNRGWELWERSDLAEGEMAEMLHAAHTAWYHWDRCGTDIHRARASVLLAYAHEKSGGLDLAGHFARKASELLATEPEGMADWDYPFVLDVERRILESQGDSSGAEQRGKESLTATAAIESDGDREYVEATRARAFGDPRVRLTR